MEMLQKVLLAFGVIGVSLSLILVLFSFITWEIAGVLIAVSLGVPALIFPYRRVKSESILKPTSSGKHQKGILTKETIVVRPSDAVYYEFELAKVRNIRGRITSNVPVDVYFLDEINFDKWDRDKTFSEEACSESILDAQIDYEVPKDGKWFLVIENDGRKSARVKLFLY